MPLPGGITTCVLTGTYLTGAGIPLCGTVSFAPSSVLTDTTGLTILTREPAIAALQPRTGTFAIPLACTDNADLLPSGWMWSVTVSVPGAGDTFWFLLPSTLGDTADISSLTPATPPPAPPAQYVTSVNGQSGVVVLTTAGGITAPAGDIGNNSADPHVVSTHLSAPLPVVQGGTGAASGAAALAALGGSSTSALAAETTRAEAAEAAALQKSGNLSDVSSASTSRANLGLGSSATLASSAVAQTANNLSDLVNDAAARNNLGLTAAAIAPLPLALSSGGTGSSSRNFAGLLTEVATPKTGAYTASAGDFVTADTTSAGFTVTLPNAPADLAVVGVKLIASATPANALTIARNPSGSDVFDKTSGATSATLQVTGQSAVYQYQHATGIWLKQAGDLPLSQLDTRYAGVWNVKSFGAAGNAKSVTDGAMTASSATLTSASAGFTIADVGKTAIVAGAGAAGAPLNAAISGWTSTTQVTLASTASTTVSSAVTCYGNNETTACQAAINAQQANGGVVFFPPGVYLVNGATTGSGLICAPGTGGSWTNATRPLIIRGSGRDNTTILSGNQWAAGGLLTAGSSGVNVQCALTDVADITLDGNYSGSGGVLPQASVTQGALVCLPWPGTSASGSPARNGQYHVFTRVRFYRPTAYGFQPTTGVKCVACDTLDGGQPDQPTVHYDNFGSGQADAIILSHTWKDSSGNYCDFVATSGIIRLIMIGCESYNHGPGGVYGCGSRSIITGNNLDASAGGIGYDVGTSAGLKSSNIVANNNCPNMSVNGSLSFHSFGDLVYANISSDQSNSQNLDIAGNLHVQNSLVIGTVTNTPPSSPNLTSDGTNMYFSGTGSGRVYFRAGGYGVSSGQFSVDTTGLLYVSGPTATTATAGSQTLPANPAGFLEVNVGGTTVKVPYYAV